jgi:hypothetical protein
MEGTLKREGSCPYTLLVSPWAGLMSTGWHPLLQNWWGLGVLLSPLDVGLPAGPVVAYTEKSGPSQMIL